MDHDQAPKEIMRYLQLTQFQELATLVTLAADGDETFIARIVKRVADVTYAMLQITSGFDGKHGGAIVYDWLPVKFYMAVATATGDYEYYDGFKIGIACEGIMHAAEIFIAKRASAYKHGVFERAQIGGWQHNASMLVTPPKTEQFLVTLSVSDKVHDPETLGSGIRDAIETYVENVISVEHLETK